jgi:hypothetical protein
VPLSLNKLGDVRALLRAHMAGEAQAGFPKLRRIPSSSVVQLLDYVDSLTAGGRDSLLDTLSHLSAFKYFPPLLVRDRIMELVATDPAWLRCRAAMQSAAYSMGLRHQGVRMIQSMITDPMSIKMMAQTRATLDFTPRDDLPKELVPDPDLTHLKPAKAPLTKKLIGKAFRDLFATGKQQIHGETAYTGSLEGTDLTVWVDFGARGLQLRYGVSIPDETRTVVVSRLMYEDLWTAGPGWDDLTEENAETSIALLCDQILQLVQLRNRVMRL